MTGFSLPKNYTDNPERLVRRARPRVIPPLAILPAQEPILEAPLVLEAMAEKTLHRQCGHWPQHQCRGRHVNKDIVLILVQALYSGYSLYSFKLMSLYVFFYF